MACHAAFRIPTQTNERSIPARQKLIAGGVNIEINSEKYYVLGFVNSAFNIITEITDVLSNLHYFYIQSTIGRAWTGNDSESKLIF